MKFRSAPEARQLGAPLVQLFATGLARAPDAAELAEGAERLRAGDDLGAAAAAMVASAEFEALHGPAGPPDRHYLRALFWNALGRDPSVSEGERLLLQPNASRASVLAQVSQSTAVRAAITLEQHFYGGALPPDDDAAYQLWLDGGGERSLAFAGAIPAVTVSLVVIGSPARPDLLDETLDSLRLQTSPHWEALLVGGSLPPGLDPRVRLVDAAGTDANAMNRGAASATGCLVGVIAASDRLAPQAVEAAARHFAANPALRLLYTDEDSIGGDAVRFGALLKGGWSPDALLAGDVLGDLVLFNRRLAAEAGGWLAEAGSFAALDLALRLTVDAGPGDVVHQPGILFHRGRAQAGRPAPFPRSRASNGLPELDGVIDRFLARHRPGLARGSQRQGGRIWPTLDASLPDPPPRVSVIVPTRDQASLLAACLDGLLDATDYPDLEVILVDNGSVEADALALLDRARTHPVVKVLRDDAPFNWSALNNRAAAQATGDVLVFMGSDVAPQESGWLRRLAAHAVRPGIGVAGVRLLHPDGTLQHGGVLLGPQGAASHVYAGSAADEPGYGAQVMVARDLSAVTGACLAIRRALFEQLGGLEQDHLEVAWSDIDLCLRAREAGWRVLWDPAVTLVRQETAARGPDRTMDQEVRFETERSYMRRRWPAWTRDDPYLNPALRAGQDGLVFRSVLPPGTLPASAAADPAERSAYELATLRSALHDARAEAAALRRAWPHAELAGLQRALVASTAAEARLAATRSSPAARLDGLPPRLVSLALRLRGLMRAWAVLRRLGAIIRRTPARRALLRQRRADYAVIAGNPAFDEAWYRAHAMAGDGATDAVSHYLWNGPSTGHHQPHALFDPAWYAARTPALGLEDPFAHYLRVGMADDADPHPLFDTAYYMAQAPDARGRALLHHMQQPAGSTLSPTRLFDPVDYPAGLAHWACKGAAAGQDPGALFATAWYRQAAMGGDTSRNPLGHWLREGEAAGLPPNPYGLPPTLPHRLPQPAPSPAVTIIAERGAAAMDTTRTLLSLAQHTPGSAWDVILCGPGPRLAPASTRACAWAESVRLAPSRTAAVAAARGRMLVFLGAGAVVQPDWLRPLLAAAEADPAAGLVGCATLGPDGTLRSNGALVAEDGHVRLAAAAGLGRAMDAPDPGAFLVRRDAWAAAGGPDRAYDSLLYACADLAFALRARGWHVALQPASLVMLPHPAEADTRADWLRLRDRWAATLSRQPAASRAIRRVLVLADAVPGEADGPAAITKLLQSGAEAVLHAPCGDRSDIAAWEQRGLHVLRSPVLSDAWLATNGPSLDEVWSFRHPDTVPLEALLRWTGARLLHRGPGTALPPWCAAAGTAALAVPDTSLTKAAA